MNFGPACGILGTLQTSGGLLKSGWSKAVFGPPVPEPGPFYFKV